MAEDKGKGIDLKYLGPIFETFGAIQGGVGSYFAAKAAKADLKFRAFMAERTAQSILEAAQADIGRTTLKAGKVKGSQKAGQGSRGIVIGVGSAAEEIATTDLMKETDVYTIRANATREALNSRIQGSMDSARAEGISPFMAGFNSLLGSASTVATGWYNVMKKPAQTSAPNIP